MTHEREGPKRTAGTNSLVVLGIIAAFGVLAVVIWMYWSATNNRPEGDEGPSPAAQAEAAARVEATGAAPVGGEGAAAEEGATTDRGGT